MGEAFATSIVQTMLMSMAVCIMDMAVSSDMRMTSLRLMKCMQSLQQTSISGLLQMLYCLSKGMDLRGGTLSLWLMLSNNEQAKCAMLLLG